MNENSQILISTLFTGYNYGSSLQAYATETIVKTYGYQPLLIKLSGGLKKGRDVRLKKLTTIFFRLLAHPKIAKKVIKTYHKSISLPINDETKSAFIDFEVQTLNPVRIKWRKLKQLSKTTTVVACLCGSDQIWNSESLYVDPLYYIRFSPACKRIAFAPSFGRECIPRYNANKITNWVSQIPYLSVREKSAADLIEQKINRKATIVIDPTLLISKDEWRCIFGDISIEEPYLFVYFLNEPNDEVKKFIKKIAEQNHWKICTLSQFAFWHNYADLTINAGPKEFLTLVSNAKFVCTDSFHGTAFSLNFNIPFFVFPRNYETAGQQTTRIDSLLNITKADARFITDIETVNIDDLTMSFSEVNNALNNERKKGLDFLHQSLRKIEEG